MINNVQLDIDYNSLPGDVCQLWKYPEGYLSSKHTVYYVTEDGRAVLTDEANSIARENLTAKSRNLIFLGIGKYFTSDPKRVEKHVRGIPPNPSG